MLELPRNDPAPCVSMGPRPGGHGKDDLRRWSGTSRYVSMGPRPGGHGKIAKTAMTMDDLNMFQWGHDPEVMVSQAPVPIGTPAGHRFQWGHDPEVMVRASIL